MLLMIPGHAVANRIYTLYPFLSLLKWRDMEADFITIACKEHTRNLKKVRNCFTGSEAVSKVLAFLHTREEDRFRSASRPQALKLAQKLLDQRLFAPVKGCEGHIVDNSRSLYRLDRVPEALSTPRRRAPPPRDFPTPLREHLEINGSIIENTGLLLPSIHPSIQTNIHT